MEDFSTHLIWPVLKKTECIFLHTTRTCYQQSIVLKIPFFMEKNPFIQYDGHPKMSMVSPELHYTTTHRRMYFWLSLERTWHSWNAFISRWDRQMLRAMQARGMVYSALSRATYLPYIHSFTANMYVLSPCCIHVFITISCFIVHSVRISNV